MKIKDIDQFIAEMQERGYAKGNSHYYSHKPEFSLWKSFHKGDSELEHKGYQICLSIWDHTKYDEAASIRVSFAMFINHQTSIQADRVDIFMMEESMDVAEFERRCEALWKAMLVFMPRVKASAY